MTITEEINEMTQHQERAALEAEKRRDPIANKNFARFMAAHFGEESERTKRRYIRAEYQ